MSSSGLFTAILTFNVIFSTHAAYSDLDKDERLLGRYSQGELSLHVDYSWSSIIEDHDIGQIGGIATSSSEPYKVYIFHRGSRAWNRKNNLFDEKTNVLNEKYKTPIKEDTIVVFDILTGQVVEKFGANMFYVPHGLTVDSEGHLWVTDVGSHQVIKFEKQTKDGVTVLVPLLTLGEKFVPGKDDDHFCKPTSVAVTEYGDFFVADGYCNSRIVSFSSSGKHLHIIDGFMTGQSFRIPHSLTVNEEKNQVCVADRENERVVCFDVHSGQDEATFETHHVRPFGITHDKMNKVYHIVGQDYTGSRSQGLTVNDDMDSVVLTWPDHDMMPRSPHAIAVSDDGEHVFVGGLESWPRLVKLTVYNR